jgi:hypothetical protein
MALVAYKPISMSYQPGLSVMVGMPWYAFFPCGCKSSTSVVIVKPILMSDRPRPSRQLFHFLAQAAWGLKAMRSGVEDGLHLWLFLCRGFSRSSCSVRLRPHRGGSLQLILRPRGFCAAFSVGSPPFLMVWTGVQEITTITILVGIPASQLCPGC